MPNRVSNIYYPQLSLGNNFLLINLMFIFKSVHINSIFKKAKFEKSQSSFVVGS